MLNMDVCKQCFDRENIVWDEDDLYLWQVEGRVRCWCVVAGETRFKETSKEPPPECPYHVDHMMRAQS